MPGRGAWTGAANGMVRCKAAAARMPLAVWTKAVLRKCRASVEARAGRARLHLNPRVLPAAVLPAQVVGPAVEALVAAAVVAARDDKEG